MRALSTNKSFHDLFKLPRKHKKLSVQLETKLVGAFGALSIHVGDIGSPNPRVLSDFLPIILRALRFSDHSVVERFILLTIKSN